MEALVEVDVEHRLARRRAALYAASLLLLAAGVTWALADFGPRGVTIVDFGDHHGIDSSDLVAVPLFVAALACFALARSIAAAPGGSRRRAG
jgi:hypothetical protein